MDSLPLWLGTVLCAGAAAGALLPLPRRRRLALVTLALIAAPILVGADNWESDRFVELRDSPVLIAAAAILGGVLLAAGARAFLTRPWLLPVALIAAMPFRVPIELAGTTANLLLPLYAVVAAGLIAAWLRPERMMPEAPPRRGLVRLIPPLLAAVVLIYALQAGYADDASAAVENVCFFFAPFAALLLLISTARWDRALLRTTLIVIVVEGLVVAFVGFGQALTGQLFWNEKVIDGNEAHTYFRVNSLFFDPNIMGRYLAITMVLLAGVLTWRTADRRAAALVGAAFVVLLAALILTFSQTSMLALIAGIVVLLAAAWGILRALAFGAATAALLAAIVFGLGGGGLTAETTGRTGLVSGGAEIAADRPLTGYGSGSFAEEFEGRFGGGDGIAVESHTEPITFAAEQGVIGLLAYLALVIVVGVVLWRSAGLGLRPATDPLAATLLAAYAGMVVHSLGYASFLTDPITWALLAVAIAVAQPKPAPVCARPRGAGPPGRPRALRPEPEAI